MHNSTLHGVLEAFAADAAGQLAAETASGAEVPFEVIEEPGARASLYCYRPLTGAFIRERLGLLTALPTYTPAARSLADLPGVDAYLRQRGESRIPGEPRERADAALRVFLSFVFAERSEFGFDPVRFEQAYGELERALYEGRCVATVIAPLLGLALEPSTRELPLGDGLALVRGDVFSDAPADAVWGDTEEPHVLAVLTVAHERTARSPVSAARGRFRRILTALRLFERGGYALGPIAWTRTDTGAWRPVALGSSGRPRFVTFVSAEQEDELRAFCNLIARRAPTGGELAWALARFEMGCERVATIRGADGLSAGPAGAARAGGPRQRPSRPAARRDLRQAGGSACSGAADGARDIARAGGDSGSGAGGAGGRRAGRRARRAPPRADQGRALRALDRDLCAVADELLAEAATAAPAATAATAATAAAEPRAASLPSRPLPTRSRSRRPGVSSRQATTCKTWCF